MTSNPHRLRIDFVGITDMVLAGQSLAPFFELERAVKARLAETGAGCDAYSDTAYGGLIEMSCADADACYDAIKDLLLASPLAAGATAVLIYGDEDDAEQNELPEGTPAQ